MDEIRVFALGSRIEADNEEYTEKLKKEYFVANANHAIKTVDASFKHGRLNGFITALSVEQNAGSRLFRLTEAMRDQIIRDIAEDKRTIPID